MPQVLSRHRALLIAAVALILVLGGVGAWALWNSPPNWAAPAAPATSQAPLGTDAPADPATAAASPSTDEEVFAAENGDATASPSGSAQATSPAATTDPGEFLLTPENWISVEPDMPVEPWVTVQDPYQLNPLPTDPDELDALTQRMREVAMDFVSSLNTYGPPESSTDHFKNLKSSTVPAFYDWYTTDLEPIWSIDQDIADGIRTYVSFGDVKVLHTWDTTTGAESDDIWVNGNGVMCVSVQYGVQQLKEGQSVNRNAETPSWAQVLLIQTADGPKVVGYDVLGHYLEEWQRNNM